MRKTVSLRKSFVYLESVSGREDIVIIIRVYNRYAKKAYTYHCTPKQALEHLFMSQNQLRWMRVS